MFNSLSNKSTTYNKPTILYIKLFNAYFTS